VYVNMLKDNIMDMGGRARARRAKLFVYIYTCTHVHTL